MRAQPGRTAIYLWTDGRAVYVGRSAFPRERRGQHRASALAGGRSAFHTYLRANGVDSGTWRTVWVANSDAERLEREWIEASVRTGARSLNVRSGAAPAAPAPAGFDWRAGLEACRKETGYLDRFIVV